MSSEAQAVSRFRTPEPVFGVVAPEIIEETLICLATENEQYLNELSDQAGCFKETQIVGEICRSLSACIINNNTVLKFLQSLDYSYTKQNLVESELAILKALRFQINVPTPFAYVELLLEVLGHNGCLLPMKQLHKMCMHLLDLTYLMRNIIYDTLLKISIENSTPSELQM
ncbi:receptor-type tyrosine-protein phosphatase N2 [Platysternon megacephalum]|uniref:Receptor-type tyrosine-protein phosphatase N2 n=1 Tax=Platysternon megacephalum TaxID=55544 RepID=A0A4D9ETU9_9SAUR|nr:receptor-type tyrosine-protein phosphatase N2 [Platysternon megacephalum]